jgi:hypothetical protein
MAAQYVTLPDVRVMYVESTTGPAGAANAFDTLEARLPSLKGRKFYGTFQPPAGPYRACVAIEPTDDVAALAFQTCTIPGGKFSQAKIPNWEQHLPEIGKTFQRMSEENEHDISRPNIEFYRSQRELILFLPVK